MSVKICVLCGEEFTPKHNAQKVCDRPHYRECEVCGKKFKIIRPSDSRACCSRKCTQLKREQTMLNRHGVRFAQQSEEIHRKAEQTNLLKYGNKVASKSDIIKEKSKQVFQNKYGVDTPFLMDDFQDKRKATCMKKYGVPHALQTQESLERMKHTYSKNCSEKFGVPYACLTPQCKEAHPGLISKLNKSFGSKLQDQGIEFQYEFRLEDRLYDICIPSMDTLIEIDPTYTHSTVPNHWGVARKSSEQLDKTSLARNNGYKCIHIFDWDDWDKVLNILRSKTRVYARKCTVSSIESSVCSEFEKLYHIQGSCRGQIVCYGIYDENEELIQIMSFGHARYNSKYQWELLRLCTKSDMLVVGGAERLFNRFLHNYNPDSIISYCDTAKFTGEVYARLGFKYEYNSGPAKIWSKNKSKITDNLLRQRGYDQLFGTNYGKGTSNEQLMLDSGWLPIYDCGQDVYTWNKADAK